VTWIWVAQAFDLAGITNTVGAPSFAFFAKGGRRSDRVLDCRGNDPPIRAVIPIS
jgi:hypothetical protein